MRFEGLHSFLPKEAVLLSEESRRVYECDGLSAYRRIPGCVVLPENIRQVQAALRYCHEHGIPVVARGAGTGLSGGALPHEDGVLLSLARFNQILEIAPQHCIARVQPGVRNLAVSEAVRQYDLYYAPGSLIPDRLYHRR